MNARCAEAQANHVENEFSSEDRTLSAVCSRMPETLILVRNSQPGEDPNHGQFILSVPNTQ